MAPTPPSVTRGTIHSKTDTVNEKRDISEAIDFLSPFDTPLLDLVGRDSLHTPCTQLLHEWLTDMLAPRAGTLGAAYVSGSLELNLGVGSGGTLHAYKNLVPGDLVQVENQTYRIQVGPPDTHIATVTLTRGTGADGTTDAAHVISTEWQRISHAAPEGGPARDDALKVGLGNPNNRTQILKDWTIVTGTMEVLDRYGYANERAYQEEKLLRKLAIDLEFSLLYGTKYWLLGPPRVSTMGGLKEFVLLPGIQSSWNTVVDLEGGAITEPLVNTMLQRVWENGGMIDFVMVNGSNKRRFTNFATPRIRTVQGERKAGASIATYESDFGTIDIVLNRHLRPSDMIFGSRGEMGIGPLVGRQFTSRLLPHTLDGTWYEILGEYTSEVHKPELMWGWYYNCSTATPS